MKLVKYIMILLVLTALCRGSAWAAGSGKELYEEALQSAADAESNQESAYDIALIYTYYAVQCQELGAHPEAIALFKLALSEDPDNAQVHRRYGEYLMNYRGLYEYASAQYYKAAEIIQKNPNSYADEEIQTLERSMQIMHRDGKDGMPVYVSPRVSVFFEPYISYKKMASRQMYQHEQDLQTRCYLDGVIKDSSDAVDYFKGQAIASGDGILYFQQQIKNNEDGVVYFQDQIQKNNEGIAYFQDQISQNEDGIDYFNNQIQGTYDYDDYLWNELHINRGIGLDENLGDGTTIRSRMADNAANRVTLENRVTQIEADKTANEQKVEAAEADKAANEQKVEAAEADKAENEEKVDSAAKEKRAMGEKMTAAEKEKAEAEAKKERAKRYVERRPEELEYGANLLIRFGPVYLPYLRLTAQQTEVQDAAINPLDFSHPYDGRYNRLAAVLGKNVMLNKRLDLNVEAEIAKRQATTLIYESDNLTEDAVDYGMSGTLAYNISHKTLRLYFGADFSEFENDYSNDDSGNSQRAAVRLSVYPVDATERFGQGRSTHWETGIRRVERIYRSSISTDIMSEDYQPYFLIEALGTLRGRFDLVGKYVLHDLEYSAGCKKDQYQVHEFNITPTWVPVYQMYANSFRTGIENVRIGLPLTVSIGDGDFDSLSAGVKAETRWVLRYITLLPTLEGEFTRYTELDLDDWGIFAKLAIQMGAMKVIRN